MCDNRTVIMFFRYHWKFSRKKSLFTKKKKNAFYRMKML